MEEPGFWDNPEQSTKLVQEAKHLKDTVDLYRGLEREYEDIQVMIEMGYEENDESLIPEIQQMLDEFRRPAWKSCAWRPCSPASTTSATPSCG